MFVKRVLKNKAIQQVHPQLPVRIPAGKVLLQGNLTIPEGAHGMVIFAHGSGSSRFSPRNRYVAEVLNEHHLATLLADLLTPEEEIIDESTRELRFNIPMLAERLAAIADWVHRDARLQNLSIGYFGSSTGGGAALVAAAQRRHRIAAVVSRGGRPDLANGLLPKVEAPTLLIVGARDLEVIKLNRQALDRLNSQSKLEIVPRATHLFEEPGTLEVVSQLAGSWFERHLRK